MGCDADDHRLQLIPFNSPLRRRGFVPRRRFEGSNMAAKVAENVGVEMTDLWAEKMDFFPLIRNLLAARAAKVQLTSLELKD